MLTLTRRTLDAWMDIQTPADPQGLEFLNDLARLNAREANEGQPQTPPDVAFGDWRDRRWQRWQETFPLGQHLLALMYLVLSNLSESQRERLASYMATRDLDVPDYTVDILRAAYIELVCAPRNSLADPSWRTSRDGQHGNRRTFIVDAHGECEGYQGYWVYDEQNFEEGFVEEFEHTFWAYDDNKDCFLVRRNFRFKMRRPTKGKGKGTRRKGK